MKISFITLFPELYQPFLATSLLKRAQDKDLISFALYNLMDYADAGKRVDAPAYGPGSGMVLKPSVVERAFKDVYNCQDEKPYTIFFSPQGERVTQYTVKRLADLFQAKRTLVFCAGRYEGFDERTETYYADEVLSMGDYVVMGVDVPAMMLVEALMRYIPGVVGKSDSVDNDTFSGPFFDYPTYAEQVEWHGMRVPDIVRSGNHHLVDEWRKKQAIKKTVMYRFDWIRAHQLTQTDASAVSDVIPHHYIALCHTDVLVGKEKREGTTSVTSLDIHDIARSACTYGVRHFFIVTPLKDQQQVVNTLLAFWKEGIGETYNYHRYQALRTVTLLNSIDDVIERIRADEQKDPLVIATSAQQQNNNEKQIGYNNQGIVWRQQRPVLMLLGTGQGLSNERIDKCDYILDPVVGMSEFNHLSVRSAAAIILDRWLGLYGFYKK